MASLGFFACKSKPEPPPAAPPPAALAPWSWHSVSNILVIEGEVDQGQEIVLSGTNIHEKRFAEVGPVRWEMHLPPRGCQAELKNDRGKLLAKWYIGAMGEDRLTARAEASPVPQETLQSLPPPSQAPPSPSAGHPAKAETSPTLKAETGQTLEAKPKPVVRLEVAKAEKPAPLPNLALGSPAALPLVPVAPKPTHTPAPKPAPAQRPAPVVITVRPAPRHAPVPIPSDPDKAPEYPHHHATALASLPKTPLPPWQKLPSPESLQGRLPVLKEPSLQAVKKPAEGAHLSRSPFGGKRVCLTFDGGSTAECAEEILDALKQHGIHSTFFLTGIFIERFPDIVKRIHQDGHEIGNHTYSHPHLAPGGRRAAQWTKEKIHEELHRANHALLSLLGRSMDPYWRAPYGEQTREIRHWAEELGYVHVGWSEGADTLDWAGPESPSLYRPGNAILKRLNERMRRKDSDGLIVLMHLGSTRAEWDRPAQAMASFLENKQKEGWNFTTISTCFHANNRVN